MWGRELSENRELHVRGFIFRILEEDQGKAIWNFRTRVYEPGCVRAGPPGVPVVSQSAPYHGEATLSQVSVTITTASLPAQGSTNSEEACVSGSDETFQSLERSEEVGLTAVNLCRGGRDDGGRGAPQI